MQIRGKMLDNLRGNDLNHRVHVNVLNLARTGIEERALHASWSPSSLWENQLANEATIHRSLDILSIIICSNVYIRIRLPFKSVSNLFCFLIRIRIDKNIFRANVSKHFPNINCILISLQFFNVCIYHICVHNWRWFNENFILNEFFIENIVYIRSEIIDIFAQYRFTIFIQSILR